MDQDNRISPFFQSINKGLDMYVPLAMRKFQLDQDNKRWAEQLAETKRAHNINLGTEFLKQFNQTGDPRFAATAKTLLSSALGESAPGFDLEGLKPPPETQMKLDKAARIKAFTDKVRGGTPVDLEKYTTNTWTPEQKAAGMRAYEPEEILRMYAGEIPEDIKDIMTMRHQIESDKQLSDLRTAQTRYYNERSDNDLLRASKTGRGGSGGGPTAAIKNYEYFSKIYGPEFAEKLVTKTKDISEANVWQKAYQSSIDNYMPPHVAEQRADNALAIYRQKFGGGGNKGGGKESWKDYL